MANSENKQISPHWEKLRATLTRLLPRFISSIFRRRHIRALLGFLGILLALIVSFVIIFEILMNYEGQQHDWVAGLYWTLTTMSTLGYGDITFTSDIGRLFSIVVLLSGMIFLLVLMPFTFIQLFYEPWIESRAASQVPRRVSAEMKGHVILTFYDPVANALIDKLSQFNYPYVVILPELADVEALGEQGIQVMHGELNDPETYMAARVESAVLVATTRSDVINTSVAFTVRGITEKTRIIATARATDSVEILKLAGCNRVLDLSHLMAEALARRANGGDKFTHIVGQIDDLVIAEVVANRTTLVGKNYLQAQTETSVSIVGFWARGSFEVGQPENTIEANTVLVMAGSKSQLKEFDTKYQLQKSSTETKPVIIIGAGRVGRATAASLKRRGIDYRIVEQLKERILDKKTYIHGSGSDKSVLQKAGIEDSPTVIITTHDDETNIYLTIFCRLLRPEIQIICRSTLERNVAALHRAGCDIVMSYASMGSNALFNLLQRSDLLMVAEGLDVFKIPVPEQLAGKTVEEANLRELTNCSIIGIDSKDTTMTNPAPDSILPPGGEIVLIGSPAGEAEFLLLFATES